MSRSFGHVFATFTATCICAGGAPSPAHGTFCPPDPCLFESKAEVKIPKHEQRHDPVVPSWFIAKLRVWSTSRLHYATLPQSFRTLVHDDPGVKGKQAVGCCLQTAMKKTILSDRTFPGGELEGDKGFLLW